MIAGSWDTIGQTYQQLCHYYGVPQHLTFDGAIARVVKNTPFIKTINKYGTRYNVSIPRRPNKIPKEGAMRKKKKR